MGRIPQREERVVCLAVLTGNGERGEEQEGTAFFPGSSLAGEGLLVSDGEVWRRQRQLANPAFRKAAVERYAQVSNDLGLFDSQLSWCHF